MEPPKELEPHQADYHEDAWRTYTYQELAMWVHLLTKRAGHRKPGAKRDKDLYDANNYAKMLLAKAAEEADSLR